MSWPRADSFCPACQASFDAQPLGALTRRWRADSADARGTVFGLICDNCKTLVRKRNASVSNGQSMFRFVNPNQRAENTLASCAEETACAAFARMPSTEQNQRRDLHEQEELERLRWCLDHGLAPAHEHVHAAPGNNANFMVSFYQFSRTSYREKVVVDGASRGSSNFFNLSMCPAMIFILSRNVDLRTPRCSFNSFSAIFSFPRLASMSTASEFKASGLQLAIILSIVSSKVSGGSTCGVFSTTGFSECFSWCFAGVLPNQPPMLCSMSFCGSAMSS